MMQTHAETLSTVTAQPLCVDDLCTLGAADAPPMCNAPAAATRDAAIGLSRDLKHVGRPERRRMLHMLAVSNAAKALEALPARGEVFHVVMAGNFNAWDVLPAVLRLASPVTIRELNVATLGFSERNASELVELLDSGQIDRCSFIASVYFK